jgi:hypothetical protein
MVGVVDYVVGYSYEVLFCEVGFRYEHDVHVIERNILSSSLCCVRPLAFQTASCRNLAIISVCSGLL